LNLGLTGILMAAALPGFARAHLKRLAEGEDPGRCLGTMTTIQAALMSVLLLGLLVAWRVGALSGAPGGAAVFGFMLGSQLAGRFAETFLQVFIAREHVWTHGGISLTARLLRLVATALVLWLAPSVAGIAATFLLEAVLTCALAAGTLVARGIRPRAPTVA